MFIQNSRYSVSVIVALVILLGACGGRYVAQHGIEETTGLLIRGESLVGLRIDTNPGSSHIIAETDIRKQLGVWGVKDSQDDKLETFFIAASRPGTTNLTITRNGRVLLERKVHISDGQTRLILVEGSW